MQYVIEQVTEAYGFDERADLLEQLLNLNHQIACREQKGEPVIAPGLPDWFKNKEKLFFSAVSCNGNFPYSLRVILVFPFENFSCLN